MKSNSIMTEASREIYSSRILPCSVAIAYEAFANPLHLAKWWGPEGFTNTIHTFDLRPGGSWVLTMHGPEKGHYENSSVFRLVEPLKRIRWTRISPPLFDMEVCFESTRDFKTRISFRMIFATLEECEKMKRFVVPKNEENFDRLERELPNIIIDQVCGR